MLELDGPTCISNMFKRLQKLEGETETVDIQWENDFGT